MALKAAIAGTGFIGRVHARSLRLAGVELAGVAASSPESAAAAAAVLGAAQAFDSAEAMVRDPEIDAHRTISTSRWPRRHSGPAST